MLSQKKPPKVICSSKPAHLAQLLSDQNTFKCLQHNRMLPICEFAAGLFDPIDPSLPSFTHPAYELSSLFGPAPDTAREEEEVPQTFGDFLRDDRDPPPPPSRRAFGLYPLGNLHPATVTINSTTVNVPPPTIEEISEYLVAFFAGWAVRLQPTVTMIAADEPISRQRTRKVSIPTVSLVFPADDCSFPLATRPLHRHRTTPRFLPQSCLLRRLNGMHILRVLTEKIPRGCMTAIGVTAHDLYELEAGDNEDDAGVRWTDQDSEKKRGRKKAARTRSRRAQSPSSSDGSNDEEEDTGDGTLTVMGRATGDHVCVCSVYQFAPVPHIRPAGEATSSLATTHGSPAAPRSPAPTPTATSGLLHRRWLIRVLQTLCHELMHTLFLDHCVYYGCLMNACVDPTRGDAEDVARFAAGGIEGPIKDADLRHDPIDVCPICLRKLAVSLGGFDPDSRNRALLDYFTRHDLAQQAHWMRQRLAECVKATALSA
ncbi:hypothetical protein PAPYR_87 [Paratrimastix pyriformis]|uniref:Uncharacterized protein n=1 Tax=Paratrimastix pyriformis TaxID=342808 RepID=A0ABQ8UUU3_9EUKA|nr:hypothetical protein PAPYR_87 [Paratrimastix pyriformis]